MTPEDSMKTAARLASLAASASFFALGLLAQGPTAVSKPGPTAVHTPEGNLIYEAAALALVAGAGLVVWARRSKSKKA